MLQINIPKPCHENWDEMTPTTQGAFCKVCTKDVVDFTTMTDAEVQHYLISKVGEKVCGKFKNTQLDRIHVDIPETIFYSKIAGWKKFMAVVMLAFGSMLFGCNVSTDTKKTQEEVKTETKNTQIKHDSIPQPEQVVMGMVPPMMTDTASQKKPEQDDACTVGKITYTPSKSKKDTVTKNKNKRQ